MTRSWESIISRTTAEILQSCSFASSSIARRCYSLRITCVRTIASPPYYTYTLHISMVAVYERRLLLSLPGCRPAWDTWRIVNEFPPSQAPRFEFAETRKEQEDQLGHNPLLQRMREARREKSGRPASTPLPRPQRAVLLAGPLAPVLPGAAAGGPAPALGPRRQLGPHPLAGPALCHRSRTGGQMLFRHHAGGGGPGHRHVSTTGGG